MNTGTYLHNTVYRYHRYRYRCLSTVRYPPPILSAADAGGVVEEQAHRLVGELVAKTKLVRVVHPLTSVTHTTLKFVHVAISAVDP